MTDAHSPDGDSISTGPSHWSRNEVKAGRDGVAIRLEVAGNRAGLGDGKAGLTGPPVAGALAVADVIRLARTCWAWSGVA